MSLLTKKALFAIDTVGLFMWAKLLYNWIAEKVWTYDIVSDKLLENTLIMWWSRLIYKASVDIYKLFK